MAFPAPYCDEEVEANRDAFVVEEALAALEDASKVVLIDVLIAAEGVTNILVAVH